MTRPSVGEVAQEIARAWARRSTCPRAHCGAVILTAEGRVISSGFNGAPSGQAHCDDVGCLILPGRDECVRSLHAEANAIIAAARYGVPLAGGIMYCTHRPCIRCAAMIVQAGLTGVVWEREYTTDGVEGLTLEILRSLPGPVGRHP